jgi:hypothetical protein
MAVKGSRENSSGARPEATYVDRMDRCGHEQIPNFIMATFAVASFFVCLAGSLGVAWAVPITIALLLGALRLHVLLASGPG